MKKPVEDIGLIPGPTGRPVPPMILAPLDALVEDSDEREPPRVYFSQGKTVEDMDLIALAHMSVEEAATVLLQKPLVLAEEFRAFYEKLHSENESEGKEAARLIEEQAHAWDAVDLAEEAQKEAELALADENKKTTALEIDVGVLKDRVAELEDR